MPRDLAFAFFDSFADHLFQQVWQQVLEPRISPLAKCLPLEWSGQLFSCQRGLGYIRHPERSSNLERMMH